MGFASAPSPPLYDAVVGLGSNLGDRAHTLERATEALGRLEGTRLVARSRFRETAPVGGPPQGPFLNGALRLATSLGPEALLARLLELEARFGRERRERWGPRTLDLDLLWVEGVVRASPGLTLPHPRLHERLFALEPLVEVAPGARHPATGEAYASVLVRLRSAARRGP
ncbi:MAG TPA: 2-amino-4-hydroxy-6-hydroxymethyldihydropteridine diphosphokinase [Polyangiaceae bacterium]|nr:2-amino-4-hydroxy-6-hydroxymethyldihydropteridine diphosphokinase [Polyangiaceae bacterium]